MSVKQTHTLQTKRFIQIHWRS